MATAAQLVAEVKTTGVSEAKSQLKEMSNTVEETSGGFKGMLGNALSFAAGGLVMNAVGAAAGFLKDQIFSVFTESEQAQQSMAQTEAVLKSTHDASGETAQSIADLATQYSHLTLFSDDTIQAGENMLLTFTNIGKSVFPQATKTVLDMSQALGQDTKSSAIQLGKALNDPITGITALQRVGVTFTDSQKNLIKSLVDSGNVAGAQKVILAELQREFGGSAEAAGKTFPGQLQILGQSLDDIKQNIGDALMPILSQLVGWVSSQIVPAFGHFSDWITTVGVPALRNLGGFITGTIVPAFQGFAGWLSRFMGTADTLRPILIGLGAVLAVALIPEVWSLAAGVIAATWPILAIGAAVVAAVAIFEHFYNTNAQFKAFIDGLVAGLKLAWTEVQQNFLPTMQKVGDWLKTYVWPILQQVGAFLVSTFTPVWKQLVDLWNSQLVPLFKQIQPALQQMMPLFQAIGAIIGGVVIGAIAALIGIISGLARGIAYAITGIAQFIHGFVEMWVGVATTVGGIVQFIVDLFTGKWGKLAGDLQQISRGILQTFHGMWDEISGLVQAAVGFIYGYLSGFITGVINFFQHLASELVGHSVIPDMWNAILSWFESMPARIVGLIANFAGLLIGRFNSLKSEAIGVFQSLVSQIGSIFGQMASIAGSAWGNVWGAIKGGINGVIGLINNFIRSVDAIHVNVPGVGNIGFSIPTIPLLARGGNVVESGFAVLGDAGPEVAWMPRGAQVIPNNVAFGNGGFGQQPIIVIAEMDGQRVTRALMPHIANEWRYRTGVFGM